MSKIHRFTSAAAIGVTAVTLAFGASAYTGEELAPSAKLQIKEAEALALKACPGNITDRELEREAGGLRYSFDIKRSGVTYEVGIDANSGAVLENAREGAHPD